MFTRFAAEARIVTRDADIPAAFAHADLAFCTRGKALDYFPSRQGIGGVRVQSAGIEVRHWRSHQKPADQW